VTIYGQDVNNPGASKYPRFAVSRETEVKDALIIDIVLNEDHPRYAQNGGNVGEALTKFVGEDDSITNWALPEDTVVQQYPLVGEVVSIRYSGQLPFYSKKINVTNKVTDGVSSTLVSTVARDLTTDSPNVNVSENYRLSAREVRAGNLKKSTSEILKSNIVFPKVHGLRANEGDTIVQGRFGNTLRFGSSLFTYPGTVVPSPNILISVGQYELPGDTSTGNVETPYSLVYEDVNRDKSSIWMVSNEEVRINPATNGTPVHLRGSEIQRNMPYYTGAQIFINSDRLVLNSKRNEISLFAKTEINLSALKAITISSGDTVFISSDAEVQIEAKDDIFLKASNVSIKVSNNLDLSTKGAYSILGEKIFIGAAGDTTQPMVLGGTLSLWLQNLMDLFIDELPKSFATLNPTPFLLEVARLRTMLGTPLTPQSAVFNSKHNFTAKENKV